MEPATWNSFKMAGLMSTLPGLWSRLRAELLAFAEFLEELAHASQTGEQRWADEFSSAP